MQQWSTIDTARIGKHEFVLARRGDDWVVRVDQQMLMSNRVHQSELELARQAIERAKTPRRMFIGGLGLGYTLRAALDVLPADARVTVAELVPQLVEWNRTHLRHLNGDALVDARCDVLIGDAFDLLAKSRGQLDVIVLDVDNGPQALSQKSNSRLYGEAGIRTCRDALAPGGVLGVWSAGPDAKYVALLAQAGFKVEAVRVRARPGAGSTHHLFFGQKLETRR